MVRRLVILSLLAFLANSLTVLLGDSAVGMGSLAFAQTYSPSDFYDEPEESGGGETHGSKDSQSEKEEMPYTGAEGPPAGGGASCPPGGCGGGVGSGFGQAGLGQGQGGGLMRSMVQAGMVMATAQMLSKLMNGNQQQQQQQPPQYLVVNPGSGYPAPGYPPTGYPAPGYPATGYPSTMPSNPAQQPVYIQPQQPSMIASLANLPAWKRRQALQSLKKQQRQQAIITGSALSSF